MDLGFSGAHAFVTGAAGGIGLGTVSLFLEHGAYVTAHYNSTNESLRPLLEKYPDRLNLVQADCRSENAVINAIAAASQKFGTITILIANHGIFVSNDAPIQSMELAQWNNTIAVNLTGIFLFVREYMRQLDNGLKDLTEKQRYGCNASVVLVGSTAGKFGEAGHIDYASSKSALMYGFMRSLKNEIVKIAPRGRVNCVNPGWVYTAMAQKAVEAGKHYSALLTMPMGKIATIDDVAHSILVVASSVLSGHVSGTAMEVDGGMEGRVLNTLEELKKRPKL